MRSFECLMRRWEGRVGGLLVRLLGPGQEVEDACQEVFLKVYLNRFGYRQEGRFSTWLFRITLNVGRDLLRRKARQVKTLDEGMRDRMTEAKTLENPANREVLEDLRQALAELPGELKEVLVLKHFGELTFEEVAKVTGLPLSTVKSRTKAALLQLRSELNRHGR